MRTRFLGTVCVCALLAAAGCSSDNDGGNAPSGSALTLDQATRLSQVLVDNHDRQGATFSASLNDGSLTLVGEVDGGGSVDVATIQDLYNSALD